METTTIRVPVETRDKLNELARRLGTPAGDVVTALVNEADDRTQLETARKDWERIALDPETLAAYRSETGGLGAFEVDLPDY